MSSWQRLSVQRGVTCLWRYVLTKLKLKLYVLEVQEKVRKSRWKWSWLFYTEYFYTDHIRDSRNLFTILQSHSMCEILRVSSLRFRGPILRTLNEANLQTRKETMEDYIVLSVSILLLFISLHTYKDIYVRLYVIICIRNNKSCNSAEDQPLGSCSPGGSVRKRSL